MKHVSANPARGAQPSANKQLRRMRQQYQQVKHALGERVKELTCLYGISQLIEQHGHAVDRVLRGAVTLLPPAWQYPGLTMACITVRQKRYPTPGFRRSRWLQAAEIVVNGNPEGQVAVCYRQKMPNSAEGPFLAEERALINDIAERLGRYLEREVAVAALNASRDQLVEKNAALEKKNIALQELLEHFEREKKQMAEKVAHHAEQVLLPLIEKINGRNGTAEQQEMLRQAVRSLAGNFGIAISHPRFRLSAREIAVCNLIKNGAGSKQISQALSLSIQTVDAYRKSARRKLGLTNRQVNLCTFLKELN